MPRRLLVVLALLLFISGSVAQSERVDGFIRDEMQKHRIPGVSIAVVKDGKLIKASGYGLANVEHSIAVKPDTVFKIGSVSKQFIATGIMVLGQDGKLALTDPIKKHLPDAPDTWKDVTIWHLLTHTSGIIREGPAFDPLKTQPDIDVIRSAYSAALTFKTGEKWEYCNVGYFALAEIIARVSGKPWPAFMEERVFKPSGMDATRTTTVADLVPNRALGYGQSGANLQNAMEFSAVRPSGAFLSTALDLAKWDAVLYTDKILSSASREQMSKAEAQTPNKLDDGTIQSYGFGWFVDRFKGRRRVHHGGSLPGFRATMMRFPDDKLTIIVLTNANSGRPQQLAEGIAGYLLEDAKSAAAPR